MTTKVTQGLLTLESFDFPKHIMGVARMGLSLESLEEIKEVQCLPDGVTPNTVVLTCLQASKHAYVIRDESQDIVGACGVAVDPFGLASPWFLSSGFERKPQYLKAFLRGSTTLFKGWLKELPYRIYHNRCLNDPRIVRWLRWLGFTVATSATKRFVPFQLVVDNDGAL